MNIKNKFAIFKVDRNNKPLYFFYIFFLTFSLGAISLWMLYNARGSLGDGTGNQFPILFQTSDLFTDWLLAHSWATIQNPWDYVGSIFADKLPPSLYGPTIFMFLKLLPPYAVPDKTIFQTLLQVGVVFCIFLICWISLLKVAAFITNGVTEKSIVLSFFILLISYPAIFAINRGNTAIISYFYLCLFLYFCINKFSSYLWIIFLNLYTFSSIQLFPLFIISSLACLTLKGLKPKFIYLLSLLPIFIYVASSGVTFAHLKSTYLIQVGIVKGWGGIYNHDVQSSLRMLKGNQSLLLLFLILLIFIPLYLFNQFLRKNKLSFNLKKTSKAILTIFNLEKNYNIVFLVFLWSSISLIISFPSADYHLLRILPFVYLSIHIVISQNYQKINIPNTILFTNIAASGVLLSYLKLWQWYKLEIFNVQDLSVPIRALSLLIWTFSMVYFFASWKKEKLISS